MTGNGGGSNNLACAACKYQRRKCTPNCPLAPYFPASEPRMFQNVHRLFGVSNVTKILRQLRNKDHRDDAMKSIIYEADMRRRFPVHGCSAVIHQLRWQLEYLANELRFVCSQLESYRKQHVIGDAAAAAAAEEYWNWERADDVDARYNAMMTAAHFLNESAAGAATPSDPMFRTELKPLSSHPDGDLFDIDSHEFHDTIDDRLSSSDSSKHTWHSMKQYSSPLTDRPVSPQLDDDNTLLLL